MLVMLKLDGATAATCSAVPALPGAVLLLPPCDMPHTSTVYVLQQSRDPAPLFPRVRTACPDRP